MAKLPDRIVHVAVGVICNNADDILIALRPEHLHQGGLWEFPGGKVEPDEDVITALQRELQEELGISFYHAEPLIKIKHDYTDKSVLLDVWSIMDFTNEPKGLEGQEIAWVARASLSEFEFPEANVDIVKKLIIGC